MGTKRELQPGFLSYSSKEKENSEGKARDSWMRITLPAKVLSVLLKGGDRVVINRTGDSAIILPSTNGRKVVVVNGRASMTFGTVKHDLPRVNSRPIHVKYSALPAGGFKFLLPQAVLNPPSLKEATPEFPWDSTRASTIGPDPTKQPNGEDLIEEVRQAKVLFMETVMKARVAGNDVQFAFDADGELVVKAYALTEI